MTPMEEETIRHLTCSECWRNLKPYLGRIVPTWHKHELNVRFDDGMEIVYCVTCGEEW